MNNKLSFIRGYEEPKGFKEKRFSVEPEGFDPKHPGNFDIAAWLETQGIHPDDIKDIKDNYKLVELKPAKIVLRKYNVEPGV